MIPWGLGAPKTAPQSPASFPPLVSGRHLPALPANLLLQLPHHSAEDPLQLSVASPNSSFSLVIIRAKSQDVHSGSPLI